MCVKSEMRKLNLSSSLIKLAHHLSINTSQECIISSNCIDSIQYGGRYCICEFENRRRFVCKLFTRSDELADNIVYYSDSVELLDGNNKRPDNIVGKLNEITVIEDDLIDFEEIEVELDVNPPNVDLKIIRSLEDIKKLIRYHSSLLCVSKNCHISFDVFETSTSAGIEGFRIKSTNFDAFGRITQNTKIKISKINFLQSRNLRNSKKLGGLNNQQLELQNHIQNNRGILISGPAGSGKISLIKKVSSKLGSPLFEIRGLDFLKQYPGETEEALRDIFRKIYKFHSIFRDYSPILLIKDIDSLCPAFENSKSAEIVNTTRISSQLISLLDENVNLDQTITVIGTTSNLEALDYKLRRAGRCEHEIHISIPSEIQRKEILTALLDGRFKRAQIRYIVDHLAVRTPGYVGADYELVIQYVSEKMSSTNLDIAMNLFNEALRKIRPTALRDSIGMVTDLSNNLDMIGGMEDLKKSLRVSVLGPLNHPEAFKRFGMKPLKGILLYGPPGCAKTTIAKCLASEAKMTFLSVSAAEVYSPYVGDSEKLISRLFNQARMSAPSVIFLDEIDALVGNRTMQGQKSNDVHTRVLSTLLIEMDGIGLKVQSSNKLSDDSKHILVIAATNRPDMIDNALLRPGRLTKLIHVPAPDKSSRLAILEKVKSRTPIDDDVVLEELADITKYYSGADIINLCNEAALHAASIDMTIEKISKTHFDHILQDYRPSLTKSQINWYNNYEKIHKVV